MLALKALSTSRLGNRWLIPVGVFPISPFSELAGRSTNSSSTCLVDCLITKFEFPETKALSIAARIPRLKSSQKPQALFAFLRGLGFSLDCIQSTVSGAPQILFANVDKNLKPKIELFQKLGFESPRLVKFLSKNGAVFAASLEKKLRPRVHILLETFHQKDSYGIVGSQLSMLLKMQPRLFIRTDCQVRDIVSRTLGLGFSVESRMFIYGLSAVSAFSVATLDRKFAVFEGFGFSRSECIAMFRRGPTVLGRCDEKLSSGVDFFLNTVNLTKEMVVRSPALLMYSMEGRVIPRYRVLKTMESKFLFKKKPSFSTVMTLTNERFVEKFIFMYPEHSEELLIVYNGRNVDSSADAAYS
ncbi:unnamed protein product [Linum tenue]|uniref:Uncharacterized protein n=1 Tax=Linum tenue TaxID=586396 RepID=A0AAV0GUJ6_9ROSI|nr:unnamed protein product [Linum tenue]